MFANLADFFTERLRLPGERVAAIVRWFLIVLSAIAFVLAATAIIAFDSIFVGFNTQLRPQMIAPRDIVAPLNAGSYISEIRTEELREERRAAIQPIFDPPDPNVARQQTQLASQIIEYIENVRADIYGTQEQRIADLNAVTALTLDTELAENILQFDDETFSAVEDEIINVLSRTFRQEIRPDELARIRMQLQNQVNTTRFNPRESDVIVAIVEDLVRPNAFENVEATENARSEAANAVDGVPIQFVGGQIIVREGEFIDAFTFEALEALNLVNQETGVRSQNIMQGLLGSLLMMGVFLAYLARLEPKYLHEEAGQLALIGVLFLLVLAATRLLEASVSIYLFPAAMLSLLYASIAGIHVGIISGLGLGFLVGIMLNDSLEIALLFTVGNLVGALAFQRIERANSFVIAGLLIGLANMLVVAMFNLSAPRDPLSELDLTTRLWQTALSGVVFVPASAFVALYAVTNLFNLPTSLRLFDLLQPNKPLLQRLLREAPGTYQHSLQVANLAEQAANAIGADAQLTHVAALYHDIGKMLNPLYFTENQQDIGNPHDTLNDPYRSADIIIGHATEGDELARQHRLPQRIRDFIREHHGTTTVFVFYQRALRQTEGGSIDKADFRYPGPRPRSKETAILLLADSCEAAVRSAKPNNKQEIADLVQKIIDSKRSDGQLDESGLTLNDLGMIQAIFTDILQSLFHPRIDYNEAIKGKPEPAKPPRAPAVKPEKAANPTARPSSATRSNATENTEAAARTEPNRDGTLGEKKARSMLETPPPLPVNRRSTEEMNALRGKIDTEEMVDEEPLSEVPRLPTINERRSSNATRPADDEEAKNASTPNGSREAADENEPDATDNREQRA